MAELQPERWEELLHDAARTGGDQPLRIAQLCVEMLDVTGAGVSLVSDIGNREVVCATDDVAMGIEELQLTLGEGPCVDAIASGGPVLVPDLDDGRALASDRWPAFLPAAAAAGVRAVFAFPLRIGVIKLGAIDLYRTATGPLQEDQLGAALLGADAVAVAMLEADRASGEFIGGSIQAQVHQATGMVMVQAAVTIEQAFLLLRAHAFASNRALADVAADVVGRRLRFDSEGS